MTLEDPVRLLREEREFQRKYVRDRHVESESLVKAGTIVVRPEPVVGGVYKPASLLIFTRL